MAEKRMISKSISISEKVNSLPEYFDMLLFTWMIPHADDFGRLMGESTKVKALVIPLLPKTVREVSDSLQRLHDSGLIVWYTVDSGKFIQIVKFEGHQTGLHKRTKSRFPEVPGSSRNIPEIPGQEKGREENGREQNGREGSPPPDLKMKIQTLLDESQVEDYTIHHIEVIASYFGVVDYEVLEHAIIKSKKKHVNYTVKTIEGLVRDGKTTKESVKYIHAVPDKPKHDPELESRRMEIARNKWIAEGKNPDEFVYRPASGT